jgi:hypothetical protein
LVDGQFRRRTAAREYSRSPKVTMRPSPAPRHGAGTRSFVFVAEDTLRKKKRASESVRASSRLLRRVESCAPSTTLLRGWSPPPLSRGRKERGGCRFDNAPAGGEEQRNDRDNP